MKKTVTVTYHEFEHFNELPKQEIEMIQLAYKIAEDAYAPYSKFHVGAVALLEDGTLVKGSNQENIAYPSGLCAERVAIFHASAKYPNIPIKKIAVSVASKTQIINEPVSPCGGCRQVISEYEMKYDSPISIIMSGETGQIYVSDSIENLLPIMFNKKHLK